MRGSIRFHCFLDRFATEGVGVRDGLTVHPGFHYQLGPSIPYELFRRAPHRDRFLTGYPIVWSEDPSTGILAPFWVRREWALEASCLRAGAPVPALSPAVLQALDAAGVLVDSEDCEGDRIRSSEAFGTARVQLANVSWVNFTGALHPSQRLALVGYFDARIAAGEVPYGDSQCGLRFFDYNETMARFVLHQFTGLVERVAGERLIPCYACFVGYRNGALLERHTDREQCEYSASVLLQGSSTPDGCSPWPLYLATRKGDVAAHQSPGDALIYRGRELPHWRSQLPPGCYSDSLLLHYVKRGFTGSLH